MSSWKNTWYLPMLALIDAYGTVLVTLVEVLYLLKLFSIDVCKASNNILHCFAEATVIKKPGIITDVPFLFSFLFWSISRWELKRFCISTFQVWAEWFFTCPKLRLKQLFLESGERVQQFLVRATSRYVNSINFLDENISLARHVFSESCHFERRRLE